MAEVLVTALSILLPTLTSIASLAHWLGRKFAQIDASFRAVDERFKAVEGGISALRREFDEGLSLVERKIGSVAEASRNQLEFFAEFLGYRRVISQRDVAFVKGELYRLSTMHNPLTREEAGRLKELLDKEKLTLEEADELREIARKLVKEYGDRVGETWKLLIYASIMRGIALSELEEQGEEKGGERAAAQA